MIEPLRIEVSDQHGTVAVLVDLAALHQLSPRKRAQLDALTAGLVRDSAAATGSDEEHARWVVAAYLARRIADERVYERVCQRKGLLAL